MPGLSYARHREMHKWRRVFFLLTVMGFVTYGTGFIGKDSIASDPGRTIKEPF